jgi:hypothetical protein
MSQEGLGRCGRSESTLMTWSPYGARRPRNSRVRSRARDLAALDDWERLSTLTFRGATLGEMRPGGAGPAGSGYCFQAMEAPNADETQ